MKLLLTGATGFVGSVLLERLMEEGIHEVACVGRNLSRIPYGVKKFDSSLPGWDELAAEWRPQTVVHLAAAFTSRSTYCEIEPLVESNILFTTQLAEIATRAGADAFINCGTFTEYLHGAGEPMPCNLYSATKSAIRPILQYFSRKGHWKWVNVVIYSPYGRNNPKKKVLDYLKDAIDAPSPTDFSPGMQVLDFIHVEDMADFFVNTIEKVHTFPSEFTQLHLGTGRGHTLREAAMFMERATGKKVNARWGGRPYNPEDPMHAVAPVSLTMKLLDWQPTISLEKGIAKWLGTAHENR